MNIQTAFYHGVYHQIKRVFSAMTDEQLDRGLDAFETGGKDWSHCFFARAFKDEVNLNSVSNPEFWLANRLGLGTNRVPVRIIYTMFDESRGSILNRKDLYSLMSDIRDGRREFDIVSVLSNMNFNKASDTNAKPMIEESYCYSGVKE